MALTEEDRVEIASSFLIGTKYEITLKAQNQQVKQMLLTRKPWNLKQLHNWTHRSPAWLKTNVLYVPAIRKQIDRDHGGFVKYATNNGSPWEFPIEETMKFFNENKLLD